MIGASMTRNGLLLGVFAMLTTGIIAATQLGTKDRIAEQFRLAKEKALLEIVPRDRHDNQMLDLTIAVSDMEYLFLPEPRDAFVATQAGQPVAVIFPVTAPDGYSGKINMLVGINLDGSIAGVRVVQHAETPGLGDKVELKKSDWILSFNGRSIGNPEAAGWAVKKDKGEFDQFTGATITPRAVTRAVYKALNYFQLNQESLMQAIQVQLNASTAISQENSNGE